MTGQAGDFDVVTGAFSYSGAAIPGQNARQSAGQLWGMTWTYRKLV
jgi:hypothetical protein